MNLLIALTMFLTPVEPDFNIASGYGIDPHFAKAVAVVESGWRHDSKMARNQNNIFGMYGKSFESVNQGIHYWCRLIKTKYPKDINAIAKKYCPPNAEEWAEKVRRIMWSLQKKQRKY